MSVPVLVREFDSVFNELFGTAVNQISYHKSTNENEYLLEIPLAGNSKEDVKVFVEDRVLKVNVKKNTNRFSKDFAQSWTLMQDANPEAVTANMENGVLTVKVGKTRPQKKVVDVTVF